MPTNADRSPASSDTPTESGFGPRERLAIWLLLTSAFVVILNETIMINAIPRLMTDLHVTERSAQWVSTAFMLTMAAVIPVTGWFLQRVTTRTAYAVAMATFSAGNTTFSSSTGLRAA